MLQFKFRMRGLVCLWFFAITTLSLSAICGLRLFAQNGSSLVPFSGQQGIESNSDDSSNDSIALYVLSNAGDALTSSQQLRNHAAVVQDDGICSQVRLGNR